MVHIEEINSIGTLTTLCGSDDYSVAALELFGKPVVDCRQCLKISGADDVVHYEHTNNTHNEPVSMCFKRVKRGNFIPLGVSTEKVTCEECVSSLNALGLILS